MTDLIKKLQYIKIVSVNKWQDVINMVENINKGTAIVHKAEWANYKRNYTELYKLDLHNLQVWSTVDNNQCVNFVFTLQKDKIICKASIYDADTFYGQRQGLRFTAEIHLPKSYVVNICHAIEHSFDLKVEREYENYLEKMKKDWVGNRAKEILKKK